MPVKRTVKVLQAKYVDDAQSILLVGECAEGKFRQQLHRDCFSFGNRTEEEIVKELEKTAAMMVGKNITIVFDPELDNKIQDGSELKY